jgi:hypothetical protein
MNGLIGSLVGDTLMGMVAVLSATAAGFLMWGSVQEGWSRRRQRRDRERTRREFWGFE